jgi:hypothetical protein
MTILNPAEIGNVKEFLFHHARDGKYVATGHDYDYYMVVTNLLAVAFKRSQFSDFETPLIVCWMTADHAKEVREMIIVAANDPLASV